MNKIKSLASKVAAGATVTAFSSLHALAQGILAPPVNVDTQLTTVSGARDRIVGYANVFVGIVGLIAVIMLVYGGYLYISGGASDENVKKAKNVLLYAFLGLALAVLSYAIVRVSVNFFGGGN